MLLLFSVLVPPCRAQLRITMSAPMCKGFENTCGFPAGRTMDAAVQVVIEHVNDASLVHDDDKLVVEVLDDRCDPDHGMSLFCFFVFLAGRPTSPDHIARPTVSLTDLSASPRGGNAAKETMMQGPRDRVVAKGFRGDVGGCPDGVVPRSQPCSRNCTQRLEKYNTSTTTI